MRPVLLLLLLAGCPKKPTFDLSIPDAPSAVTEAAPQAVIEEAGRSDTPEVRARAIAIGLHTEPERFEQWAGRGTYDPDGWVQHQTAEALAELAVSRPAARDALARLVGHEGADAYSRSHAAVLLSQLGPDADLAQALLSEVQASRDPWVRSALALGALALGSAEASDALTGPVARGDIALELSFIQDLGRVQAAGLDEALASAQERVEPEIALMVAAARVEHGDDAARSVLIDALSDEDPLVQLDAIHAALTLSNPARILKSARRSDDPAARTYAAIALEAERGRITERSERALVESDVELRLAVLEMMPASDVQGARQLARRGLADDSPRVRALAARRLGQLGLVTEDGDEARLQSLLVDEDVFVRVEAAGALLR